MTTENRRSPLAHRDPVSGGNGETAMSEVPFRGVVQLRGEAGAVAAGARSVLGLDLPASVGDTAVSEAHSVLWLAPDEWIIFTAQGEEHRIIAALSDALASVHHQVVDVSDYYTTIELKGSKVREQLAKLIAIDLHAKYFPEGRGIATNIAKVTGWVHCLEAGEAGDRFHIVVRRSQADYLWCMLADAGREWGLPAQSPIGQVKLHLPHFA